MIGLYLAASAAFAAPDHAAWSAETTTAVTQVAASPDGSWVGLVTTGGQLGLVDTSTWTAQDVTVDGATVSGGVAFGGSGATPMMYAGLSSNEVGVWTLVAGSNPAFNGRFSVPGDPLAIAADSTSLYVLYEDVANGPSLQAYDITSGNYAARYTTVTDLPQDGFQAMDTRFTSSDTGAVSATFMYVAHGGAQLTRIALGTDSATATRDSENEGSFDINDVWVDQSGSATWFANGGSSTSYGYQASDGADLDITSPSSPDLGPTTGVGGSMLDGWLGLATSTALNVYSYSGTTIGDQLAEIPEGAGTVDIATINGYGFLATSSGVQVVTDRPWVEIGEVSSTSVAPDEVFTLSFTADAEGSWQVYQQVAASGLEPTAVDGASGSIAAGASGSAEVSLPAVDNADARYLVEVRVTPTNSGGSYGRDGTYVYVNSPAPTPTIDGTTVSFGDQRIRILFDAFDATSAQSYPIWVSTEPWTADEYPVDGPAYVGPDDWPADGLVAFPENGVVDCVIDGVTNGTTYYVAAQAVDVAEDGTEEKSPMSDVYAVTPEETFSVSERLGIESWCGLPLESAGWLGSVAAAFAVVRRRRGAVGASRSAGRVVGAAAVLVALGAPAVAQAAPHEDDLTPRNWDFELRYGPFLTQDSAVLTDAFGATDNRLLRGNIGYTKNLFQVDLGFGLYSDTGGQSTTDGTTSSDSDKLTAFPLSLEGTLRLDFWKEQPVVPFGRLGGDAWIWNETWSSSNDASGGGDTTAGTFGWHWGAGLFLLLDGIDEGSASRLETTAGINDTYLVAEYQQTYSLGDKKLDFTSTEVTFGLKFDY